MFRPELYIEQLPQVIYLGFQRTLVVVARREGAAASLRPALGRIVTIFINHGGVSTG
jgi:hypothetical protein